MPVIDLKSFPGYSKLSEAGKLLLSHGLTHKEFPSGASLLHKGQPVSGAYFVLEGRLRIYSISPSGQEATLYTLEPGETCVLALNSLFNNLLYPAWVQAEAKSSVAVVSGSAFRMLFESEPAVRDVMVNSLATMVFGLMEELQQVYSCNLEQRLANLLLTRATADGVVRMTQQQMAQHLGTTREVIARLVRGFVTAKFIATLRGRTIIHNTIGLAKISAASG